MRDSVGGGSRPPPKPRPNGGARLQPASGAGRMSSGDLKGSSWGSGEVNPMDSSSACEEEPLHGTLCEHMEEGEATPVTGKGSCGTAVRNLCGGDHRPTSYSHLEDSAGMMPASDGWRASSDAVDPSSGGQARGGNDVCMIEGGNCNLPSRVSSNSKVPKVHALMRDGEVLTDNGIFGSTAGMTSSGVLNENRTHMMAHYSQELHGNQSDKIFISDSNMQGAEDPYSACHFQCTPGVRQYAPSIVEQQNPKFDNSTASPRPWSSPTTAWNRPKVVPMPPKKELGQLSLDGTTALLDDGEIDAALKRLNGALVGRMFGRKIPYPQLSSELKRRWERFGTFRLVTLSSDCFICLFDCAAARDAVLVEGPWVLFGQVLGLDRWSPSFSLSSSDGFLTPVWVRMPELPFFCWTATNIARIVALIGEPLWIDSATDQLERGLFARACVRVDLSKPLKAGLWIEGKLGKFFQPLEYEGLSMFCFRCSQVGHKVNSCKLSVNKMVDVPCPKVHLPEVVPARPTSLDAGKESLQGDGVSNQMLGHAVDNPNVVAVPVLEHVEAASDDNATYQDLEDRGAGPWMMVVRKRRPNKGRNLAGLHDPMVHANASGRVGLKQGTAGGGKQANLANRYSQKPLYVKKGVDWNDSQWNSKAGQVQDYACSKMFKINNRQPVLESLKITPTTSEVKMDVHTNSMVQYVDGEQPAFGGFKAMPTSSVVKLSTQRKDVQMDGMGAAIPPVLPAPCSKDLVVVSCATPKPSMHVGEHISAEPDLDTLSSPNDALILYSNQDDRMSCGIKSFKKERMLNELGPISLNPRKRRMIVLNHDGGVASPLPTS